MPFAFECVLEILLKVFFTLFWRRTCCLFLERSVQHFLHIGRKVLSVVQFRSGGERSFFIPEKIYERVGCGVVSQRILGRYYWFSDDFFSSVMNGIGIEYRVVVLMLKSFDPLKARCIPLKSMKTIFIPFGYFDWICLVQFLLLQTLFPFFIVVLFIDRIHEALQIGRKIHFALSDGRFLGPLGRRTGLVFFANNWIFSPESRVFAFLFFGGAKSVVVEGILFV